MAEPLLFLSLDNVTLQRGGQAVFPHTNWTLRTGEHWAIVGPNGSGKSTLMQALSGHVPVLEGSIVYHFTAGSDGRPESAIAHVAFEMPDASGNEPAFYQSRWNAGVTEPGMTVDAALAEDQIWKRNPFEVVDRPYVATGFADLRTRTIQQLGIQDLLTRDMRHLSNGEQRKVNIARVLLRQPRLLILDNVFEGLDPVYRAHLAQVLAVVMQSPVQVLLVSADPSNVPPAFDHFLVIDQHRVTAQGHRSEVESAIEHVFSHTHARGGIRDHADAMLPQPDAANVLIHMRDVDIAYNGTPILQAITWDVRRGERWALFGPNGAGKTTLLSLIMGDHPQAYANHIELFGRRRGSGESIWDIKRRIGWMAPELQRHTPPLAPCMDVVCSGWFDSVGLFRRCTQEQRRAARAVMADVGIQACAEKSFRTLSETEQRLVLLARALVKKPQLLILDEPCQGLDNRNRQRVYDILDSTTGWADSLLLVTHHTHHLPRSISHILTLQDGRTVSQQRRG